MILSVNKNGPFLVLQIESPVAYNARGFVSGQMFNKRGEVYSLFGNMPWSTYSFCFPTVRIEWFTTVCAFRDQLIISITQEGVIRKAKTQDPDVVSKL